MNVLLSLGTNLGNRLNNINTIVKHLKEILLEPVVISSIVETEPIGVPGEQPYYYNCVLSGVFNDTVFKLLEKCQTIEIKMGRQNKNTYAARIADIDILLADSQMIFESDLVIPHPQMLKRRFCMEGACEIAAHWNHPLENQLIKDLYHSMAGDMQNQTIRYI